MTDQSSFNWLEVPAEVAARRLLGCELVREYEGRQIRVRIVETEAYDQTDEASHTFKGKSNRNAVMFETAGYMYVYFIYGRYHCMNVVCGGEGFGSAVLLRAVEPIEGIDVIEERRGVPLSQATNGPGKLCEALGIDLAYNGHCLDEAPIQLVKMPELANEEVTVGPRIGISKAVHELRRFYIRGNPFVSR